MLYLFIHGALQITAGHRQQPEKNHLRALVGKKPGYYKDDRPLFAHKKRILKLPKLRDLFFF